MVRGILSGRGLVTLAVVAFLTVPIQPASADIAPEVGRGDPGQDAGPDPIENEHPVDRVAETAEAVPLKVIQDATTEQNRLIIPKALIAGESNAGATASAWRRNTIFGGITLSLVMACGGLTVAFARRRRPVMATTTVSIALLSVLTFTGIAMANLARPTDQPDRPLLRFPIATSAASAANVAVPSTMDVVVETVDDGNEVVLVIGKQPSPPPVAQPTASPQPR